MGRLDALGFDAWLLSPEYRPELTAGYDFGELSVSLRASLLLMGPARASVGGVWGGLDNANVFVGHSEMLYVENPTRSHSVWYFGAGSPHHSRLLRVLGSLPGFTGALQLPAHRGRL